MRRNANFARPHLRCQLFTRKILACGRTLLHKLMEIDAEGFGQRLRVPDGHAPIPVFTVFCRKAN
jgi:hypothetical protein